MSLGVAELRDEGCAALQSVVRVVGAVPVGVREPHVAVPHGADKGLLARVQPLVRLQLAALREGFPAPGVVARVRSFT